MIDIKNFHSNLLKTNKKSHEDTDIYYIGYITVKKFSVNPLCLIIYSTTRHFKEKNDEKYLIIHSTEKYKKVFLGSYQKLKHPMVEKNYK